MIDVGERIINNAGVNCDRFLWTCRLSFIQGYSLAVRGQCYQLNTITNHLETSYGRNIRGSEPLHKLSAEMPHDPTPSAFGVQPTFVSSSIMYTWTLYPSSIEFMYICEMMSFHTRSYPVIIDISGAEIGLAILLVSGTILSIFVNCCYSQ